ncbi:unnamed protein product, partial [Mesorhabditis belari]|uniref:Protein kish n=1 Tax=Mesorhabditis belari TaxID=2138241 RepID=A0AAF3J991_9BILA
MESTIISTSEATVHCAANHRRQQFAKLSAIFNFQSLICVILLLICTCTYIRAFAPRLLDRNKEGLLGIFWKLARIGERLSPWVAASCFCMAVIVLFF